MSQLDWALQRIRQVRRRWIETYAANPRELEEDFAEVLRQERMLTLEEAANIAEEYIGSELDASPPYAQDQKYTRSFKIAARIRALKANPPKEAKDGA